MIKTKKAFVLLALGILFLNISLSQNSKEYLFVGNSLITYKHNHTLEILDSFLIENDSCRIDNYAINGGRLFMLLKLQKQTKQLSTFTEPRQSDLFKIMKHKTYNSLILQQDSELERRYYPTNNKGNDPWSFINSFKILDSLAQETNTEVIIFENYISFIKMKKRKKFKSLADSNYHEIFKNIEECKKTRPSLKVIPSGYLVMKFIEKYPKARTKLLLSMHPHKNIQYLLACLFYVELTGNNPIGLEYDYKLKPSFAMEIRRFVWKAYNEYHQIK